MARPEEVLNVSPFLQRPLRTEAEVRASRMVNLCLTRDELTSLMHALEVAKDEARKAMLFANAPRNPAYPQASIDMQHAQRNAAGDAYQRVTELCDRVTDVWRESR